MAKAASPARTGRPPSFRLLLMTVASDHDNAAQTSVLFPLDCSRVNVKLTSTVYLTRPTYSVVEGPGGVSVGNRMITCVQLKPTCLGRRDPW